MTALSLCKTGYLFQLNVFFSSSFLFSICFCTFHLIVASRSGIRRKKQTTKWRARKRGKEWQWICSCTEFKCHINISWIHCMALNVTNGIFWKLNTSFDGMQINVFVLPFRMVSLCVCDLWSAMMIWLCFWGISRLLSAVLDTYTLYYM